MGYWYQDNAFTSLTHTMTYTYDNANRLTSAVSPAGLGQSMTYDRYGNLYYVPGTGPQYTYDGSNHLTQVGSTNLTYDGAGNLSNDGTFNYAYDGEGRFYYWGTPSWTAAEYFYNALGQRVERSGSGVANGPMDELYDAFGNRALIWNNGAVWEYPVPTVAGRNYVKYQNGHTYFLHSNSLGSTGTITDEAGNWLQGDIYDPWGQRWATYGTTYDERYASMMKRDAESGLDSTPNRMFTSNYGRWLSPDPLTGDITNPQSLNRYAYVMNNPTSAVDPLGLCSAGQPNCPPNGIPPSATGMVAANQYYGTGPNKLYGDSIGNAYCTLDGVAMIGAGCGQTLEANLHGSAAATFDQAAAPPWNFEPVSAGAASGCPGCYWNPENDDMWDPPGVDYLPQVLGVSFFPDGTFTSTQDYKGTIATLKQAGLVEYPQDYTNFFHLGARDLRDASPVCSAHIGVSYLPNPFAPDDTTTGTWHIDTVNPWAGSGVDPVQILAHGVTAMLDALRGSQNCH